MSKKLKKYYDAVPNSIKEWFLRNITVNETTEIGTAAATMNKHGQYIVLFNSDFWDSLDPAHRPLLLLHECHHILQGHVLSMVRGDLSYKGEKINPKIANIAMDCIINEQPMFHEFVDKHKAYRLGTSLASLGKQLTMNPFSWKFTYQEVLDILKDSLGEWLKAVDDGILVPDDVDVTEAHITHAKVILDARELLEGSPLDIGTMANIRSNRASNFASNGNKKLELPEPLQEALPDMIAKKIRGYGKKEHVRSYAREGRSEGIKGVCRKPRARVLIAMDVSGSCTSYWELLASAAAKLRREFDVEMATFSTTCEKYTPSADVENYAGGTLFQPVLEYAESKRADILVCASDLEFFDFSADTIKDSYRGKLMYLVPPGFTSTHVESTGHVHYFGT